MLYLFFGSHSIVEESEILSKSVVTTSHHHFRLSEEVLEIFRGVGFCDLRWKQNTFELFYSGSHSHRHEDILSVLFRYIFIPEGR